MDGGWSEKLQNCADASGARNSGHSSTTTSIGDRREEDPAGLVVVAHRHQRERLENAHPLREAPAKETRLPRGEKNPNRFIHRLGCADQEVFHVLLALRHAMIEEI